MAYDLFLRHCGLLLTLACGPSIRFLAGPGFSIRQVPPDAYATCENGQIPALGPLAKQDKMQVPPATRVPDATEIQCLK